MTIKDRTEDNPESSMDADQYPHFCSFCEKSQRDIRKMIAGPDAATKICDECVQICVAVLAEEDSDDSENEAIEIGSECMEIGNVQLKRSLNFYTDATRFRICRIKNTGGTN